MDFTGHLLGELSSKHLLKHPFYQEWTEGQLPLETLKLYSRQYYQHVAAFPRYISATHSGCEDIKSRQVLLDNLIDEEKGNLNHPELWMRFAESLGEKREDVESEKPLPQTKKLVDTFMELSKSSYAEGLGALFAYEYQVPEVAASKMDGLKKFYGVTSEEGLSFFDVHLKADQYHSQAVRELLNGLTDEEKIAAQKGALLAAQALWNFLDGMTAEKKCG